MSAELEALEEIYARWAVGDWSPSEIFAEDTVYTTFDADGDEVVYHGREAMAGWLRSFLKEWIGFRKEMRHAEVSGNRVFVRCHQSATGRTSGIPLEMPAYDVWTFEGGRVTELYVSRHEDAARAKFNAR